MFEGTILDRLAGAMKTLGKRGGKALTPRQRVAAAQRWNNLADIGEDEVARLKALADDAGNRGVANSRYVNADEALVDMGISNGYGFRNDNPFRLDWMGEPQQYEARLRNYSPLTDAQYERMLEREAEVHLRGFDPYYDDFDYMWRY